jgi:hypothetical protein
VDLYYHRDDLIDKFLYAAVAENGASQGNSPASLISAVDRVDEVFVSNFIIIFRKFARPTEVLNRLLERYRFLDTRMETNNALAQFAQMRCDRPSLH